MFPGSSTAATRSLQGPHSPSAATVQPGCGRSEPRSRSPGVIAVREVRMIRSYEGVCSPRVACSDSVLRGCLAPGTLVAERGTDGRHMDHDQGSTLRWRNLTDAQVDRLRAIAAPDAKV